ncbi:hypothetical protein DXU06_42415 [Bradyrhizobium elkanii]|nr:hypothetical protein CO675_08535 [Bradyrhizobium sp. C9]
MVRAALLITYVFRFGSGTAKVAAVTRICLPHSRAAMLFMVVITAYIGFVKTSHFEPQPVP